MREQKLNKKVGFSLIGKITSGIILAGTAASATSTAGEVFKDALMTQTEDYVIPSIILLIIVASVIAYMKTKDWTTTLVAGAISAAILAGASTFVTSFDSIVTP